MLDYDRAIIELSRLHLLDFTEHTMPEFESTEFHKKYYEVLNLFAEKKINNRIQKSYKKDSRNRRRRNSN